jgi:hypothetical protein
MSRKHFTRTQRRGNGWLDPRGTKEAHENRDMTNRKGQPMAKSLAAVVERIKPSKPQKRRARR